MGAFVLALLLIAVERTSFFNSSTKERRRLGSRAGSSRQCCVAASVDFFEAQGRLEGAGRLDLLDDGQHLTADSVLRGASLDPRLATGWRAVAQKSTGADLWPLRASRAAEWWSQVSNHVQTRPAAANLRWIYDLRGFKTVQK